MRPRRRVVITAGPTHEHLDPVRYLGNESSGKMGFELARAAQRRGDEVTLIAGPVALETPKGVQRIDIVSARDLLRATKAAFAKADLLIMAAAVADWRPKRKLAGKWRLKDSGVEEASIELVKNPDIVASLGRSKGERMIIGFALETSQGLQRARAKMERKNTDFIVLNDASALGSERNTVTILGRDGSRLDLRDLSKTEIAARLVELAPPEKPRVRARKA
jgi:phosphopantothenoylcysteine decarboxylase/phosphopantothenate--cysteine ligase